jgi:hypothetical protein
MRRVRIAAFALAAALACVAISQMFSIEPAEEPQADNGSSLDALPPTVPAPPPLPGEKTAQPAKKHPAPSKFAHEELMPGPPPISPAAQPKVHTQIQAQVEAPAEPKPVIWRGGNDPAENGTVTPAPVLTETASLEEPKGPVIVVPHERSKENGRGTRWLKAVGRVLGIGGKPSPEDEAFR